MTTHASRITPVNVVFALMWAVCNVTLCGWLWWGGDDWTVDLGFMLWFTIVEGVALAVRRMVTWRGVRVSSRDTMSECATWFARMAKPAARWWQSWNAVVVIVAGHWAWLVARQPEPVLAQVGLFAGLMGFLVFHWLYPERT